MYLNINPLLLTCRSPLHAGSGSDLGIVDLPIQREKHTGYPKIESSSLKGALRQSFSHNTNLVSLGEGPAFPINEDLVIDLAFGPSDGDKNAGALGFSDARILLFPVKCLRGIFAWVTCPAVLSRFRKELKEVCLPSIPFLPELDFGELINSVSDESLCIKERVTLEEFTIPIEKKNIAPTAKLAQHLGAFIENKEIEKKLVVVDDELFSFFVQYATAVITRVKIGDSGTVEHGPFNEEYLPTETILYSHILSSRVFAGEEGKGRFAVADDEKGQGVEESDKLSEYIRQGLPQIFQLGANASLGKGLLKVHKAHFSNYYKKANGYG